MTLLSEEDALRAYAAMINTRDGSAIDHLLADDFHYSSQSVFGEIETKGEFVAYITKKLRAVHESRVGLWAEMGLLEHDFPGPCVVLAQGHRDNLVALVLAKVAGGRIVRLDMCTVVPPPSSAIRLGDYPESFGL